MVVAHFLKNANVVRWLDGIEPVWTALDFDSVVALHREPSVENQTIRLEPNLGAEEIAGSAVVRTAAMLLRRAAEPSGVKLTATGNLSRAVVGEMLQASEWPAYDKEAMLQLCKVVNEQDFLPLHFVRTILQMTKLTRRNRGKLVPTRLGQQILSKEQYGTLQALLFHVAFWHIDLSGFSRAHLGPWPQADIGIVLWSLSVAANDWMPREKLARLCTVPVSGLLGPTWDVGSPTMEASILRPLAWFGLLDVQSAEMSETGLVKRYLYRKAPLFDRFIKCHVKIERARVQIH